MKALMCEFILFQAGFITSMELVTLYPSKCEQKIDENIMFVICNDYVMLQNFCNAYQGKLKAIFPPDITHSTWE